MTEQKQARYQKLMRLFNDVAPIAKTTGMVLSFTDDGRGVFDLPYNDGLDNAAHTIHGGICATLLDNAGWFTAAAAYEQDWWLATSQLNIHLLKPARSVALKSIGRAIQIGKRQAVCDMELFDQNNKKIAHATGTYMLLEGVPLE